MPSLSLLLGLPIPYSSLGSLIPELFVGSSTVPASKSNLNYESDFNSISDNIVAGSDVNSKDNIASASVDVSVSMVHLADALLVNALQVTQPFPNPVTIHNPMPSFSTLNLTLILFHP